MPRKPNYGFERAERNRAKAAKKEEKLKRQQTRAASRDATPAADSTPNQELAETPTKTGADLPSS